MVTNADLPHMTPAELLVARCHTECIVVADPGAFVWTGPHTWITAATWGAERLARIDALLTPKVPASPGPPRRKAKVKAWT
ncbi:MAG: hypothetical protein LLG45_01540 [Actinomycetia bacterium]|nr:hypothetical protein [Actinomycetes bacterium]